MMATIPMLAINPGLMAC